MAGWKRAQDEEYYEDEGAFAREPAPDEEQRSRLVAVFSTSYGLSVLVHVGLLLVLAVIIVAAPPAPPPVVTLNAKPAAEEEPFREDLERDVKEVEPIDADVPVDAPFFEIETELQVSETPLGELDAQANEELPHDSVIDPVGLGPGGASRYGTRFGDHATAIGEHGGDPGSEEVVRGALRWLMAHQAPDGRWDGAGWQRCCGRGEGRPACSGPGTERAAPGYDVGLTSLALLAFLGHGSSEQAGAFRRTVRRALRWLVAQQAPDGSLGFDPGVESSIYNHALATMVLCEAYTISGDFALRAPCERAVEVCLRAQNPGLGWKYGVRSGRNDTSVTGWMVLALKAARFAGIEVPDAAFAGARAWFERATATGRRSGPGGSVGYETPGGGSAFLGPNEGRYEALPAMTAVAALCRVFAGEHSAAEPIQRAKDELLGALPAWPADGVRPVNFYYWYYGTYAVFQLADERAWRPWNQAMQAALLPHQRRGGCEDGSWDPVDEWCLAGGRVYATAINALTLEIYYRYDRGQTVGAEPDRARRVGEPARPR